LREPKRHVKYGGILDYLSAIGSLTTLGLGMFALGGSPAAYALF
jgi:hypothetical protein